MANRHAGRILAMQSLYEWDFKERKADLQEILKSHAENETEDSEVFKFAKQLASGVLDNLSAIDEVIKTHAPEWPIEQISLVDRNVLRIGIFEFMFLKDAPPKVIINEAVELVKDFGGESSSKFLNGVMGTLYKENYPNKEK